tara:strand:+ start:888 stop:1076 length:189 start_codon:yes stop_codon:yes gene_type:complete
MKISNIKVVDDHENIVSCIGDDKTGAHPKVYLNIRDEDGEIECYYCGKTFIYKSQIEKKKNV